MKTLSQSENNNGQDTLHGLVQKMVKAHLQAAVTRNSFFINDVPRKLEVSANREIVESVLTDLFRSVSGNAAESCIRITAKAYGSIILLHLRDSNSVNDYAAIECVEGLRNEAEKIKGYIGITRSRRNETVFAFSFPNFPCAA